MANIVGTNATEPLNGTSIADTIMGLGGRDTIAGGNGADRISGGDGADIVDGGDGDDIIYGHSSVDTTGTSGTISATVLTNIGNGAVFVTGAPGDEGYVYAVNKNSGIISRVDTETGAQTTFLDIPTAEFTNGGERGLLGLAFHPQYESNGRFFVFLNTPAGDLQVREYARVAGDPPTANVVPVQTVITIPHPTYTNHNGGSINFGPDGNLYIATGDGGGGNDPGNNAQNIDVLLGKMLRLNINADDFPADADRNYAIPAGNPFAGATPGAAEIWAFGLRNPWRFSFDSATGDMYIGDVGQGAREEVDYAAAGGPGGINYGWDVREGTIPALGTPTGSEVFTDPVFDYPRTLGASVTGGYVYHGPAPGLDGAYVFADFVSGRVFSLRMVNGVAEDAIERTAQITGATLANVSAFGTDLDGNLYAVTYAGTINRLDPSVAAGDGADSLAGGEGNDRIHGGHGNDTLMGDAGNDVLEGGPGNDLLQGGAGNDTYVLAGPGDVIDEGVAGSDGIDTVRAGYSFSLAAGASVLGIVETVILTGQAGFSAIGDALANTLVGNAGNNRLVGGVGNDRLVGGLGNDMLIGWVGRDVMTGNEGADNFRYLSGTESGLGSAADIITDFGDSGLDVIDLSAIFGPTLSYRGTLAFSAVGQVRISDIGDDVLIEVNLSGSLAADMSIRLGHTEPVAIGVEDFVL